jgi:lycopene beta-cyclase
VTDLLVAGAGPAGLALAGEAAARGLAVAVIDPAPDRPWRRTLGAWHDEVPARHLEALAVVHDRVAVVGEREVAIGRRYALFDTDGLQQALRDRCGAVAFVEGRAVTARRAGAGWEVGLSDGSTLPAAVVVDCTGARRALLPALPDEVAEQVAHGVVVDRQRAGLAPGEARFMDWRADHGEAGDPTFLYALDLGDGRALLEETSLARRPGLAVEVVERRLRARLATRGIDVPEDAPVERVRFPLEAPVPRRDGPMGFGAAGGQLHPASGYSVAASLRLAPGLAHAIAQGGHAGGHAALWPRRARAARAVHRRGLEVLLRLDPTLVPVFFERFLSLPVPVWSRYLASPPDLPGTLRAMSALWLRSPAALKRSLAAHALRP